MLKEIIHTQVGHKFHSVPQTKRLHTFLLYLYGTFECLKASDTIHFKYMENQSMKKKFEVEIFM